MLPFARLIEEAHAIVDHSRKLRGLPPARWKQKNVTPTEEIIKRLVGNREVCPKCFMPKHVSICLFMFQRKKAVNGSARLVRPKRQFKAPRRDIKSYIRERLASR